MVEFVSLEAAQRAFTHLNGADIYSNCCTLKIEYAKASAGSACHNYNCSLYVDGLDVYMRVWRYTHATLSSFDTDLFAYNGAYK